MPPDDRVRIEHMIDAAREALHFAQGKSIADLRSDRQLARALMNAVQEIGEAAVRLTPATRALAPEIPWDAIVRTRNVLVHVYWGIDFDKLWHTIDNDLHTLLASLDSLLSRLDQTP